MVDVWGARRTRMSGANGAGGTLAGNVTRGGETSDSV